ncbi:MAG: peptidoglycan-associated lipoprotein Pal [Burkholderiaceae bacterium]|jgi:peptidoglycan-associated lipoprotein|nr:peptidoglycan-associated lipoprotein Pal [Burkholderiaceae bacterium]
MKMLAKCFVVLSVVLVLGACETVTLDERIPASQTSTPDSSRTVGMVETGSTDPLNDPRGELSRRSVYFDYDSYVVKETYRPILNAHARYLSQNRQRRIIIQGNTDERGGSEYNLALGQKRAEAVRKALSLLGVGDAQMEAVSFGKEKPKALGSNEAAWAENRRADIVY